MVRALSDSAGISTDGKCMNSFCVKADGPLTTYARPCTGKRGRLLFASNKLTIKDSRLLQKGRALLSFLGFSRASRMRFDRCARNSPNTKCLKTENL